ncbi:glycoside hydrolase family 28 protein [Paenibacillus sp.]|uniref:glycoside hydrolase family 28 protein n=1 Tax=Paenibacillus sp. TaxID=58172 RepID=UPI002811DD90|nr:glycoside hydrolase family 28 protein [Paenibacillus sp.]
MSEQITPAYAAPERPRIPRHTYSILDYGAVAGAMTPQTAAIQAALDACAAAGGGTVVVPAGLWRTGPLSLRSRINLHVTGGALVLFEPDPALYPIIPSMYEGSAGARCKAPLDGEDLQDVAITGAGVLDGGGQAWRPVKKWKMTEKAWLALLASGGALDECGELWWPSPAALEGERIVRRLRSDGVRDLEAYEPARAYLRPTMLSLRSCKRVSVSGPTFQNSPAWCLHLFDCEHVTLEDTNVRNPWYSQNGDGLDLESCRHARVERCTFDVGDDAICLKSGKDEEGRRRGLPCEYVTIRSCTVYHGHGGVVIGSEMSGGVRRVRVSDCTFVGTDIGLRFKSARGRGGVVEDIVMERIRMADIVHEAVSFHMFYAGKEGSEGYDEAPRPVTEETPIFRNIALKDIECRGAATALLINGLPEQPLTGLTVDGFAADTDRGIVGRHAQDVTLKNVRLAVRRGEPILLDHCRNVSYAGADECAG